MARTGHASGYSTALQPDRLLRCVCSLLGRFNRLTD